MGLERAPEAEAGELAVIDGVDLSVFNQVRDWKRVAASGVKFVCAKATEGDHGRDAKFREHISGAVNAGLMTGAYVFLRPGLNVKATISNFLDVTSSVPLDMPHSLDWETDGNLSPQECVSWMSDCIAEFIDQVGARPVVYTYPSFVSRLPLTSDFRTLDLWIAHYTLNAMPWVPQPWSTWKLWQWAAGAGVIGHVDGIDGPVDRDRFAGDDNAFRAWCGKAT